jgi:cardiolipin synthase
MNIPNLISLLRIFLIPLFLYLLFQPGTTPKIFSIAVFAFASITDFLDGWSARKLNQQSELGKFLDPLADKILVIAALIAFLVVDPLIPAWMVIIIVARDLLITLLRYLAVKKGGSLRTSRLGKVKTAFQMVSIIIILAVFVLESTGPAYNAVVKTLPIIDAWILVTSGEKMKIIAALPYWLMFIVTALTAVSGLRYLLTNYRILLPPYSKSGTKDEA